MKILPQFKGIIDFLSVTKRDMSDSQVSKINREDSRKFKSIKSLFEINPLESLKIVNRLLLIDSFNLNFVLFACSAGS